MKLKGLHIAEIQESVTDELREEGPKKGIFGSFSETV